MEDQSKELVTIEGEEPKTTSYIVAEQLGIAHKNMVELIKDHQERIEKHFGVLRFETAKPLAGSVGGRPEQYVTLTENQTHYVLTLSRNTDKAMEVKAMFVKAFATAKHILQDQIPALRQQVAYLAQDNASLHESSSMYLDMLAETITMPGLTEKGIRHIESFGMTRALERLRAEVAFLEAKGENVHALQKAVLDVCSRYVDVDTDHVLVSKGVLTRDQIIAQLKAEKETLQLRMKTFLALSEPEQGE